MRTERYRMAGLALDGPPSEVAPEYWTGAANMTVSEQSMVTARGWAEQMNDPGEVVHFLINTRGTSSWWVYVSDTGIYETDGSSGGNIATTSTPTGFTLGTWSPDDVTGDLISGFPYILAEGNEPVVWTQTGNCTAIPTAPSDALTCWSFKNHLFLGDIGANGDRIQWSDVVDPTSSLVPNFTAASTNQAGDAFLSDGRGAVMAGKTLGRSCMIYKNHSCYIADYIGGNEVFAFRMVSNSIGLAARHGIAAIDNEHVILTNDDVILTNGRDFRSIADGWVRRELFNEVDPDNIRNAWCQYNRAQREVWVSIPTGNTQGYCDVAYVFDLQSGRWGKRNLGRGSTSNGFVNSALGVVQSGPSNFTWTSISGAWSATSLTWSATFYSPDQEVMLVSEQTAASDGVFSQIDSGQATSSGGNINSSLVRTRLDLGDPGPGKDRYSGAPQW